MGGAMFEYKILIAQSLINEDQLNDLASNGWRLIAIVPNGRFYFYFERPVLTA